MRDSIIEAVRFDPNRGVIGEATVIVDQAIGRSEAFAASSDGRLIIARQGSSLPGAWPLVAEESTAPGALLVNYSRSGQSLKVWGQATRTSHVELSTEGDRLLYQRGSALWITDLDRGTTSRLTFGGNPGPGVWSADGTKVYFYDSDAQLGPGVYEIAADGSGARSLILKSLAHHLHASPDGRNLIYEDGLLDTGELWTIDLAEPFEPVPYLESVVRHPQFSPDSRFVAYQSEETGTYEIYVQPFPTGDGKWQISSDGGMQPRWRGDGKEIYYVSEEGQVMATEIELREDTLTLGKTEELFQYRIGTLEGKSLNLSPDGRSFIVRELAPDAEPPTATVLVNWTLGSLEKDLRPK